MFAYTLSGLQRLVSRCPGTTWKPGLATNARFSGQSMLSGMMPLCGCMTGAMASTICGTHMTIRYIITAITLRRHVLNLLYTKNKGYPRFWYHLFMPTFQLALGHNCQARLHCSRAVSGKQHASQLPTHVARRLEQVWAGESH